MESLEKPVRDEEFWFEDGTVTLVAGDVHFLVYKGILANNSPVFNDMFSLPQPLDRDDSRGPTSWATPVVHLSDSPADLRCLLRLQMPGTDARSSSPSRFHEIYDTDGDLSTDLSPQ